MKTIIKKSITLNTIIATLLFMSGMYLFPGVVHAQDIGYTSIGANTEKAGGSSSAQNPTGLLITIPSSGTISKITAYVDVNTSNADITASLYTGSAGSRGTLVTTTNTTNVTTSFGWYDFTFSSPVAVTAGTYWIQWDSYGGNGPGTPFGNIKYDTGGDTNTSYLVSDVNVPQYNTKQYSLYTTFTADQQLTTHSLVSINAPVKINGAVKIGM